MNTRMRRARAPWPSTPFAASMRSAVAAVATIAVSRSYLAA
jgi:hypothetical protein